MTVVCPKCHSSKFTTRSDKKSIDGILYVCTKCDRYWIEKQTPMKIAVDHTATRLKRTRDDWSYKFGIDGLEFFDTLSSIVVDAIVGMKPILSDVACINGFDQSLHDQEITKTVNKFTINLHARMEEIKQTIG